MKCGSTRRVCEVLLDGRLHVCVVVCVLFVRRHSVVGGFFCSFASVWKLCNVNNPTLSPRQDTAGFNANRKKIDTDYKQLTQQISGVLSKLKTEGSDATEKVKKQLRSRLPCANVVWWQSGWNLGVGSCVSFSTWKKKRKLETFQGWLTSSYQFCFWE